MSTAHTPTAQRRDVNASEPGSGRTSYAPLRIGDLAARADVSADTLRYYERRGLLQPSGRRANGYREYLTDAVGVVQFIKHAQALGLTLVEIDELLRLRGGRRRRGVGLEARDVAVAKIRDIDEKVRMLGALRAALADLVADCDQTCAADAAAADPLAGPIIGTLDTPTHGGAKEDVSDEKGQQS